MDKELNKRMVQLLEAKLTPEEELDRAWNSFMKLPKEDRLVLMLYLVHKAEKLCETQFFIRFAKDNADLAF